MIKYEFLMSRGTYNFWLQSIANAWTLGSPSMLDRIIKYIMEVEPK